MRTGGKKFLLLLAITISISLCCGMLLSTSLREEGTLIYNCTESLPQHFFKRVQRARNTTIKKGDYVEICPFFSKIEIFAKLNPYLTGSCDSGVKPFLKRVAAVEGDYIEVNEQGMFINGEKIKNTKANSSKVKHFKFQGVVPENNYLLYTENPEGYDSRYFGFITKDEITFKIRPIF